MGFVAEEYRAAPLSDEKARKCCLKVSCCTLGRRKVWVSLPKSPIHPYVILPRTFRQRKWAEVSPESVVLHPRATKMLGSVTQACRATPSGDENARKCHPSVPYFTLGRRIVWVSLPRSPIHPYVILSCTFRQRKWAEVSPESVLLHPRATKMRDSVAQACRTALLGDENVRKCCLSVPRYTLGRRKVWVSLPKSPLHPYVILPYTHGQQKWTEVSPERVVPHSRATKMRDSVAQACRAALSGDENARKCHPSVPRYTLGRQRSAEVSLKRAALHPQATKSVGFVAEESPSSLRHSALHLSATKMG